VSSGLNESLATGQYDGKEIINSAYLQFSAPCGVSIGLFFIPEVTNTWKSQLADSINRQNSLWFIIITLEVEWGV